MPNCPAMLKQDGGCLLLAGNRKTQLTNCNPPSVSDLRDGYDLLRHVHMAIHKHETRAYTRNPYSHHCQRMLAADCYGPHFRRPITNG